MLLVEAPGVRAIAGENAVAVSQLPPVWQDIASGKVEVGLADTQSFVEMAQLFQYKLECGDVDLFNERPELEHLKPAFCELFGQLALETLEFYGVDFQVGSYPDFARILEQFESAGGDRQNQIDVIRIGMELFAEFGYELPASFYHVNLSPIYQEDLFEERALRYDPRDRDVKRPWDAVLHAGKVFAIQMKLQSIASKYGFTYQHGCDCNKHLASIDPSRGTFDYEIHPQKRRRWIRSFIWTAWYEYAFFGIVPNTKYFT
ncbi:MAG: hypothetical protein SWY16_15480 [Cyanobacteriota bacterium]|nr:hypothetical protein [Cyanobacteriota bacterium]